MQMGGPNSDLMCHEAGAAPPEARSGGRTRTGAGGIDHQIADEHGTRTAYRDSCTVMLYTAHGSCSCISSVCDTTYYT
eukprot:408624-Prymnesium_polylepis.1